MLMKILQFNIRRLIENKKERRGDIEVKNGLSVCARTHTCVYNIYIYIYIYRGAQKIHTLIEVIYRYFQS
jgi:hypothetical protein